MNRAFQSFDGIIMTILIIAIVEYYCFVALKTSIKNWSPVKIKRAKILYWILNFLFWVAMLTMPRYMNGTGIALIDKYLVVMAMGGVFGKIIVTLFMLITDIILVISRVIRGASKKKKVRGSNEGEASELREHPSFITRSEFISRMSLAIGATTVGTFLYGTRNKYNYQVKNISLSHAALPPAFEGMKIVQISDIHAGSFDDPAAVMRGIDTIMDQKPDIILFTGDIVNSKSEELEPYIDIFSRLSAPMGVFAVLGNHDYGEYHKWPSEHDKAANFEQLKRMFPRMGWELIMNDNIVFDKQGSRIALVGVENWSSRAGFPKYGNLSQAVETLKTKDSAFNILMSHDPSHWEAEVLDSDVDIHLTLSGHTHGMQFGVDIPQLKWSPVKYVYDQWMGLYNQGAKYLYVNPGFGFIGYKGRVGILPEITVIELKSQQ